MLLVFSLLTVLKTERMKKAILVVGLCVSGFTFAQNYVNQVLVLNEGYFDYASSTIVTPVTIGVYNPQNQNYAVVDTLENMRFASDLVIDGNFYYVAADSKIFKMDLNTHQEVASVECPGVRNVAIWQDKLVATRGEYLTTYDSYLHVYSATSLQLLAAIDTVQGPKWAAQNIVIDGSSAYIAVNNGYEWGNEKGIIGKLDLTTLTYGNEVDLGVNGTNPDNLVRSGNYLYSVNNKDWSGASISRIPLDGSAVSTVSLSAVSTGCGTSALRDNKLVYQVSMETVLNEFDVTLMNNVGPLNGFANEYYELAQEPVSGNLYASSTDFFSYGTVRIYDASNSLVSSFDAGVSPGTIVFDVRSSVGIEDQNEIVDFVYPNPTSGKLFTNINTDCTVEVTSINGLSVFLTKLNIGEQMIDLTGLAKGAYFISFNNGTQKTVQKVVLD
jgi:hypothetical protein